uniref:Uncharacterized protein MANES_01G012100 n=1 Tax=Rhizophora mucronata TaxID=61149 RepID=A0A2P2LG46_RHIMU
MPHVPETRHRQYRLRDGQHGTNKRPTRYGGGDVTRRREKQAQLFRQRPSAISSKTSQKGAKISL